MRQPKIRHKSPNGKNATSSYDFQELAELGSATELLLEEHNWLCLSLPSAFSLVRRFSATLEFFADFLLIILLGVHYVHYVKIETITWDEESSSKEAMGGGGGEGLSAPFCV